jgi:hypothetical protein
VSLAASLIVSGIDVAADGQSDQCAYDLTIALRSDGDSDAAREAMLVHIVAILRDAADGAREAHEGAPDVGPNTIARMRRFAAHMSAALKEIT